MGTSRVKIDHLISDENAIPSSENVVFLPLEQASIETVSKYINASEPIVFLVPQKPVNTTELEKFLMESEHKVPIYFSYDTREVPSGYTHATTFDTPSNNMIPKMKLQNLVSTINGSDTFTGEHVIIISAPFDSFASVPTARVGSNNNGISIAAFLELMHQISRFPITNKFVFIFALTDGHFCNDEGLEKVVTQITNGHGSKIEFAINLQSLMGDSLRGELSSALKKDSYFAKFMVCILESMKSAGIDFTTLIASSEDPGPHKVFANHLIKSVNIVGDDEIAHVTDSYPDVKRANAVVWAVAEALLRMMYGAENTAEILELSSVDCSNWAKIVGKAPRMIPFRDQTLVRSIEAFMKKFGTVKFDDYNCKSCYAPYSALEANLILYNPNPASWSVVLFVGAIVYGILVFAFIYGKDGFKTMFSS